MRGPGENKTEIEKRVFHSVLAFPPGERLEDARVVEIAQKFLQKIEMVNTQYAIVKHTDKEHLHVHVIASKVNNDGRRAKDALIFERSMWTAKAVIILANSCIFGDMKYLSLKTVLLGLPLGFMSVRAGAQGQAHAGDQAYAGPQTPAAAMVWPHHKQAVIVLTYDDALLSQLNVAVPQLERAGLKATFFLTSDLDYNTIPRWRALAKKGYELGNHTLFHPCSSRSDNPVASDSYTPLQIVREAEVMNWLLYCMDGKTSRTYAYPCTETFVGGDKDYVDTLRRHKVAKYARIGGDMGAVITDFAHLDPLRVPSLGLEDSSSATFIIDFIKSVQQHGGMGVIMFHGIGGDYITTAADVHQQVLDYLVANKKTIWVPTFQEAMDYVMSKR